MSKGVEELTIGESNYLDSLIADRNFSEMGRQLSSLKNKGKNVEKYEKRLENLESPPPHKETNRGQIVELSGTWAWV